MPKATQGIPYTVVQGDNLSKIAKQAYGDPKKWRLLWKANQSTLRSSDPNLIFPGEILVIPADPDLAAISEELGLPAADEFLPGKELDEFTLVLDSGEIPVIGGRVIRTMDTVTDGFTATVAWTEHVSSEIKPYGYQAAKVYLGGRLVITGCIYGISPSADSGGRTISIEGFSPAADLADSHIRPPLEQKKISLKQRAEALIAPLGLALKFDASEGEPFSRATAGESETIFDHLAKLAKQRQVLISSTIHGEVIFYQAKIGPSLGLLEEGKPPLRGALSADFDGRKRFSTYRAIGPSAKRSRQKNGLEAIARDPAVPRSRYLTTRLGDETDGGIQAAADWMRSKQVADALTISVPVISWYSPTGELWRENSIITLTSETLFVPDGFDFLIRSVEFISESKEVSAILKLVPPQVYTGGPIEEPWS